MPPWLPATLVSPPITIPNVPHPGTQLIGVRVEPARHVSDYSYHDQVPLPTRRIGCARFGLNVILRPGTSASRLYTLENTGAMHGTTQAFCCFFFLFFCSGIGSIQLPRLCIVRASLFRRDCPRKRPTSLSRKRISRVRPHLCHARSSSLNGYVEQRYRDLERVVAIEQAKEMGFDGLETARDMLVPPDLSQAREYSSLLIITRMKNSQYPSLRRRMLEELIDLLKLKVLQNCIRDCFISCAY